MKILMSAFSCCPGRGSEPGVGWNWAIQAARHGHDVRVLTQICDRAAIEAEIAAGRVPDNLTFDFMMPAWLESLKNSGLRTGEEGFTLQITHLLWQFAAYRHARKRYAGEDFDIVHHITYGGIRHPTRMGRLPFPLILGPLGGGERAPFELRKSYHWRGWLEDLARDLHTWSLRLDPITRRACADALVIYVETNQTRDALPRRHHHKIAVHTEIGTHVTDPPARPARRAGVPLKLIFAGRFLYWKGMAIGLRAIAEARRRGIDVRLTMVGSGADAKTWRRLAHELGIAAAVDWRGWIPHAELLDLYGENDAFLFPSLHDSSGNVVLESFANGLPVICLDLGGPAELATENCACVVAVDGRGLQSCIEGLADAMQRLAGAPDLHARLSEGARERARQFYWPNVVASLYADVERRLAGRNSISATRTSAAVEA